MITKEDTWNWTNEQVVDHYIAHMKEQGCQAKTWKGDCAYLVDVTGSDGTAKILACGVGCLIPLPLLKGLVLNNESVVGVLRWCTPIAKSLLGPLYYSWRACSLTGQFEPNDLRQRVTVLKEIQRHHDKLNGPTSTFDDDFESFKKSLFDSTRKFRLDPNLRLGSESEGSDGLVL